MAVSFWSRIWLVPNLGQGGRIANLPAPTEFRAGAAGPV